MRFRNQFILIWLIFCCFFGCSCNLIVTENIPQLIWSASLSSSELIDGIFTNIFHAPTNGILCLGSQQGKGILKLINAETGKQIWQWQDLFSSSEYVDNRYPYINDDSFIMNILPNRYGISMRTGFSQWRHQTPPTTDISVTGWGTKCFMSINRKELLQINVSTGEKTTLLILPDSLIQGDAKILAPIPVRNAAISDSIFLITWTDAKQNSAGSYLYKVYLMLYNASKQKILYNSLQREGYPNAQTGFLVPNKLPVVSNNKIFLGIGKSFQCNDLMTGDLLWRKNDFEDSFFESGVLLENNKLFCINSVGDMYCLNPNTGAIIWQTNTKGSCRNLLFHNDVIYLTSSGNGKLYAIDANTGAYIWQLTSPDYESSNKQSFFKDNVTTDGKNIFVSTYLNLYCYKAAR